MLIDTETGDESAAIQAIVDSNDTRIDPETISSQEISQRIANKILELINISERFKTNSKVNVVMVSHSGVIENFIVDILKEERKDFIKKI
jgi:broad specificity phosphatase PhoE